jgi:DNA-binding NtrC family response regulator
VESVSREEPGSREPGPAALVVKPGVSLAELERDAIRLTLESVNGNRRAAARLLRISERTLYRKLRQHGLGG